MEFKFKHTETGEVRTLSLTEEQMSELIDVDILTDEFHRDQCKCQPLGETNHVECGCEDYLSDFELQI